MRSITVRRLQEELSDPVSPQEIAVVLDVSPTTVYTSLRRFDALRQQLSRTYEAEQRQTIKDHMGMEIPCWRSQGVEQEDGTRKGGRYIVPRDLFIRWYTTAGLDPQLVEELYGEERAS